jgi:SAM-dependent methyltransferase
MEDNSRFRRLKYNDFKIMANDNSLSQAEKIGFPDEKREGFEHYILKSIIEETQWYGAGHEVLDVGCGCGKLVYEIINYNSSFIDKSLYIRKELNQRSSLWLVDSQEVLSQIEINDYILKKDLPRKIHKVPGKFPDDFAPPPNSIFPQMDIIIVNSVLQHVFYEYEILGNSKILDFIEAALLLLKNSGKLLISDIPNVDKAKRFYKDKFEGYNEEEMDDINIMSILHTFRTKGYDTYLLPQTALLPFRNTREDILIIKQ